MKLDTTMTQFVRKENLKSISDGDFITRVVKMATLLSTPLHLRMFTTVDDRENIVEKPIPRRLSEEELLKSERVYKESLEDVLFKDFIYNPKTKELIYPRNDVTLFWIEEAQILVDDKFMWQSARKYKTVEDLIGMGLELNYEF